MGEGGLSIWDPATNVGVLQRIPGSWVQHGLTSGYCGLLWSEPVDGSTNPLPLITSSSLYNTAFSNK